MAPISTAKHLWTLQADGDLRLHFHEGQARAWLSERRFVAMLAGTQGGKTSFGPLWLYREIRRRGPGDYLAVTASFPLLKLKMLPEFRRYFEATLGLGAWQAAGKTFAFHDGLTRVIFGTAQSPESLESATAKAAWLDEAGQNQFRLESWEAILRRLSLHQGRALMGTTPYNLGWLKSQVYDRWLAGDVDYEVVQFESIANPAFPRAEYERARATLPGWKFELFYRGRFAKPAGLIYGDYVDEPRELGGHLVEPFPIPVGWPHWVGIDFGGVNTATVWVTMDPTTRELYVYRESLDGGKTTAQHVAAALAHGEPLRGAVYGGSKSEDQQRRDWAAAGLPVLAPLVADVEAGIDRVVGLFKTGRLFVFSTCRGLRDELGTYSRQVDEYGEPAEAIKDKARFHRLDALRYVAPALGRGAVRMPEAEGRGAYTSRIREQTF
jgi:hypothetical protein